MYVISPSHHSSSQPYPIPSTSDSPTDHRLHRNNNARLGIDTGSHHEGMSECRESVVDDARAATSTIRVAALILNRLALGGSTAYPAAVSVARLDAKPRIARRAFA